MTNERRWVAVNAFEERYRRKFLKKLTEKKSLEIYSALFQFAQRLIDKDYYKRLNKLKMEALSRIHSLFQTVKK